MAHGAFPIRTAVSIIDRWRAHRHDVSRACLSGRNLERFPDLHPALDSQSAVTEANRCLNCFDAPCTAACPTHIDVPGFIKKIASGNVRGLGADHPGLQRPRHELLPRVSRGGAVRGGVRHAPLQQEAHRDRSPAAPRHGGLLRARLVAPHGCRVPHAEKVACIGGGPASLACAAELQQQGFAVTVIDNRPLPGGLTTYGIAEYKLRPSDSLREVEMIRKLGVEFRQAEVGPDITLEELEREYSLVFLGDGSGSNAAALASPGRMRAG